VTWLSEATVAHLRRVAEWPDLADTKYRLLDELGRGGMGTVYLAEDTVLGRKVALKVVATGASDPQTAERMLREARIIARLEHPGIVPVHDAGALPDGRVFYAMKRVEGERLDALAARATLPERLRIFQRICEATAYAHAHGVLHRDLKPENVMVGSFGEVLVMDWGIARFLDASPDDRAAVGKVQPSQTAAGTIVGTPAYMAPEQAGGFGPVTPAADVYALGAVLYFLLTRRAPFDEAAAERRVRRDPSAAPVPPRALDPAIPRPLESIAAKAMSIEPAQRYASAEALAADVGRYLAGESVLAHRESPWERAGRVFARYRTPILLVGAYLLMRTLLLLYGRG
jgi:serine/threonine protein kinase